ncbi:MAG: hypothetical protein KBA40_00090 [Candidatus Peribacteraceae bacterium]|nr:hypothetical protein [Candidatus Peribacteraceae bacterium]
MVSLHYAGDIGDNEEVHPFRVAVRDGVSEEVASKIAGTPSMELTENPALAQATLIRSATKFTQADVFKQWPELMYVARVGVGVDNIDMNIASEAGIATINTPGASTEAVATRALTFMLAWSARVKQGTEALKEKKWPKGGKETEPQDLSEATLGVIGYGRIGQALARQSEQFFGKIVYSDAQAVEGAIPLSELLAQSDVISVHASGQNEVLTRELLRMVKPGALIVNTSRGGVINPDGLLECMNERNVSAALDVFHVEGAAMFDDERIQLITQHERFFGTPHTAASDAVTQRKLGMEGAGYVTQFAQAGTVNAAKLPGHTLARMEPSEMSNPGVRAVITHPSVKGTVAKISGIAAQSGHNISQFCNEQGPEFGGKRLAITAFDLEEKTAKDGLIVLRQISAEIDVLRSRLLLFTNGDIE